LIFLDPGHTPASPGAIGARGESEVGYNDTLAEDLAKTLKQEGFEVRLTRGPGVEISLARRAELANAARADLYIAIHHDSANPIYLRETQVGGRKAFRVLPELARKFRLGFSLFVSQKNPRFAESERLAEKIGKELVALGRPVSTYHTEKREGESRTFLNEGLGVYRYDDLVVLKRAQMPAVLVEAAVIVDPQEEAIVQQPARRAPIVEAIARGIRDYFAKTSPQRARNFSSSGPR
jgi:N-acetylmuramoyl-L-alanine amidase